MIRSVERHHPLGFKQHPLEGTGIYIYIPFHMNQYMHIGIPSLLQLFFKAQAPRYHFDLFEGTIWVVCLPNKITRKLILEGKHLHPSVLNHMCLVQFKQNQPEVRSVDTCLVVLCQNELCLASLIKTNHF